MENDKDLVEHLIHDVLDLTEVEVDLTEVEVDQTEVEVILATRIPETKADDRKRVMIVALRNSSMRGKCKETARKRGLEARVSSVRPDEQGAGETLSTQKRTEGKAGER